MANRNDDILEFTIPNWALSSLINGDDSGLEDDEIEKLNKFVDKIVAKYGNANFMLPDEDKMDLGFERTNDIDNLGNDCSLLYLRPSKSEDIDIKDVDDSDINDDLFDVEGDDEEEQKLEELSDEYNVPTEVIREYADDMGIEIEDISDLPYNGVYDSEEDYAREMVSQGVVSDLSYYLEMTDTDRRLYAQDEADSRVDNMDDDELLSESDLETEADEYDDLVNEIDDLETEIDDLKNDLYDEEDEEAKEEFKAQIEDKENEQEEKQHKLASMDSRDELVERAKDELRESYYDLIDGELRSDAVGYFTRELGYDVEDLEGRGFYVDYEKLARDLSYDVKFIYYDGEYYVFNTYERGGMMANGGETKIKKVRTLAEAKKDPRVENIYFEPDDYREISGSWWLELKEGYICRSMSSGTIHEDTLKEVLDLLNTDVVKESKYAQGGVTFDDKVDAISKALMKRKKVPKKEAIESAKKIAGAMKKKTKK